MKGFNLSLQREFRIREGAGLVLRRDVYDVLNHGRLALPNVDPTSTECGKITASV